MEPAPSARSLPLRVAAEGFEGGLEVALLSAIQDAVIYARFSDRRILDVNEAFCRIFRISKEQVLEASTSSILPDEAASERMRAAFAPALFSGEAVTVDLEFRRHDGTTFPGQVTAYPVRAENARELCVLAIIRDVTAQREAQAVEALRRQRERFLEQASTLLLRDTLDPDGTLRAIARLATRILGDYAAVDLLTPEGGIRRVILTHADPAMEPLAREHMARWPTSDLTKGVIESMSPTGAFVRNDIDMNDVRAALADDSRFAHLQRLGLLHFAAVPLVGRRGIMGAIQFTRASGKPFSEDEISLAMALASRAALAYENALLHVETKAQEARWRSLVENAADWIYLADREARILFINRAREGVRSEDIIGGRVYDWLSPEQVEPVRRLFERAFRTGVPEQFHTRAIVDGQVRDFECRLAPVVQGEEVALVTVTTRDVTDEVLRAATQEETARENAQLYRRVLASEERLKRLVENAPVQIITIDPRGMLLTVNRSLSSTPIDQLRGRDVSMMVIPEDRPRAKDAIEGVMRTGEPAEFEARGVVYPDQLRWFHVRVAPLDLADGRGAVLISSDITQRRHDEAELARVRTQLIQGEKLAALGSLVSGVAHELRTPLTYLSNNTFLLRLRLERAMERGASASDALADAERFFSEIAAGVDRINQLVEDLRRYTRARQVVALELAPLSKHLTDAVELFRATSRSRNPVETLLSATSAVEANRGALQQLLLNLLQNASDASGPGRSLRVITHDVDGAPTLEVIDGGSGMPAEVLDRMYDPLFTTKAEGTGLGLSIVKRIADEHGARIDCESTPGEGTRFIVTFRPANTAH